MKRKLVSGLLAGALAVGGYQSSARALGFPPLPPIIPDICAISCITWTHSDVLLNIEQYYAMVQNLSNVHDINSLFGTGVEIAALVNTAHTAPPLHTGDDTAAAAQFKATEDADKQQWLEGKGAAADGNQPQQQTMNGNLASVNSNGSETNLLLSTGMTQQAAQGDDAMTCYLDELGPTSTVGPGSGI